MADDILKNIPLPADLPENWTSQQTVAPTGAEVGMDEQYGYNYLMRQVNNAQRALKILAAQREEDLARIKFWASNDPTSPASFIGGTWERIENCTIWGASNTCPAGSTGGSSSHYHTASLRYLLSNQQVVGGSKAYSVTMLDSADAGLDTAAKKDPNYSEQLYYATGEYTTSTASQYISTGTTSVESCIPPYYSIYIWRRVA